MRDLQKDYSAADGGMEGEQSFQHALELVQVQRVGAVGFGFGGVVVDFEEDAVDAGRDRRAREDGDELGLAARLTAWRAEGVWTEWVPSKTTGAKSRMMGRQRMSTTRLL